MQNGYSTRLYVSLPQQVGQRRQACPGGPEDNLTAGAGRVNCHDRRAGKLTWRIPIPAKQKGRHCHAQSKTRSRGPVGPDQGGHLAERHPEWPLVQCDDRASVQGRQPVRPPVATSQENGPARGFLLLESFRVFRPMAAPLGPGKPVPGYRLSRRVCTSVPSPLGPPGRTVPPETVFGFISIG